MEDNREKKGMAGCGKVSYYNVLVSEFEEQLTEILQKGGKPELVLNRRDADGQTLEQKVIRELQRWRRASTDDAKSLQNRDEKILEFEYLLLRIRGAVYTVNGLPIPGMDKFADMAEGADLPTIGVVNSIVEPASFEGVVFNTPEEMAPWLHEKYKHCSGRNLRAEVARELDDSFPCPEDRKNNPVISNYQMGRLVSHPDEVLSVEGFRSRGKSARKRAQKE
ncbi:hypothetical protein GM415_02430 [Pseudodesulfovibrio cashew]|uniref:VHS domain-containing protein n=1 Tax=Pseudodesulfovibrio cashew TaxID=2678688 RepID=A0A6I6JD17_9BACT|nr:hypothetical protein [Pseudodesulfovibrio cashew]QGY39039.1 hypothetical protein GM415_02430 [Pseudodesulfovibrio cashew]